MLIVFMFSFSNITVIPRVFNPSQTGIYGMDGNSFDTALGKFDINCDFIGAGQILVRPHSIKVVEKCNGITVKSIKSLGKSYIYYISNSEMDLKTECYSDTKFIVGDRVDIKIMERFLHVIKDGAE